MPRCVLIQTHDVWNPSSCLGTRYWAAKPLGGPPVLLWPKSCFSIQAKPAEWRVWPKVIPKETLVVVD